jgi:hypothetical protein
MSDVTPDSGVEAPSRFMMGLEGDEPNPDLMDDAIQKAFGIDANDVTVGNPDNVVDNADGADGGSGDGEPSTDAVTGPEGTPPAVDGDEPPPDNQGQVQGDEVDTDVATGEGLDFVTLFKSRYGREPEAEEMFGLLELASWANSLTPEQNEAINRALTSPMGGAVEGQGATGPQASPAPQTDDPVIAELVEQYGVDDPLVKAYQVQQEQLTELRVRYQQQFVRESQEQVIAGVDAGANRFKESVVNAGIFPAFVQAANGDIPTATVKALEWAYWNDETYREREIQKRLATNPVVQKAHEDRQKKAASVTGTGGNGASRTEAPSKNADPWAAVAQGLREAQSDGVAS